MQIFRVGREPETEKKLKAALDENINICTFLDLISKDTLRIVP